MTTPLTGTANQRALSELFTGQRQFGLYVEGGEEVDDPGYARVEGEMCAPQHAEGGGWAVWNDDVIEFPPFHASAAAEVRLLVVMDMDGTPLASVAIEPFHVQPRLAPRFAIGTIVVRMGMA